MLTRLTKAEKVFLRDLIDIWQEDIMKAEPIAEDDEVEIILKELDLSFKIRERLTK